MTVLLLMVLIGSFCTMYFSPLSLSAKRKRYNATNVGCVWIFADKGLKYVVPKLSKIIFVYIHMHMHMDVAGSEHGQAFGCIPTYVWEKTYFSQC